jgi:hypothetical protein
MGIRDRPISPGSRWQNAIAERLIGTLRRECLNHMVIFGEAHLRRILTAYAAYSNQTRTHLALNKDSPLERPIKRQRRRNSRSGWPTPPIRTDLIFGKDTPRRSHSRAGGGAVHSIKRRLGEETSAAIAS